jgi:hypothetical protein
VNAVITGADAVGAGYVKPMHTLTFPGKGGMQTRAPERPGGGPRGGGLGGGGGGRVGGATGGGGADAAARRGFY